MIDANITEKIFPDYWRNSQLSIARFSGRCIINGKLYILDPSTDILVREDIWKQEIKDEKKNKDIAAAEKEKWVAARQMNIFDLEVKGK